MSSTPRPAFIFGTRPEAIKLAPVILEAKRRGYDPVVITTGQHREMVRPILKLFGIIPDNDLDVMEPGQTLAGLSAKVLSAVDGLLDVSRPDAVFVQGDTASAMVSALAAFYQRIPIAHVEAGLRTDRLDAPFPEEGNRRLIGQITRWHLPPTERARQALERDAVTVTGATITVTGNTVIDALYQALEILKDDSASSPIVASVNDAKSGGRPVILITGHRRENFGKPFEDFCLALKEIAERYPKALLVYPVHLNPNVQKPVKELLGGVSNITLCPPTDYPEFVQLMQASSFIITDSGGVQEEAPSLGKRVIVTRDVTERPEAVDAGVVELVGPNRHRIVSAAVELLDNPPPPVTISPYGDGKAAGRCLDAVYTG